MRPQRERQQTEALIFQECLARLDREPAQRRRAIVLAGEGWHQGVVGIVASRLAERYACPAFMICLQDGKGKGSCRSFGGFNLFEALESCADLLEGYGGHALAAGFTIREEQIGAFRRRIEACVEAWTGGGGLVSTWRSTPSSPTPPSSPWRRWRAWIYWSPAGRGTPSRCSPCAAAPSPRSTRWGADAI